MLNKQESSVEGNNHYPAAKILFGTLFGYYYEAFIMMEFEALHIPALTEEVATRLENSLENLPGVERLKINRETREVRIVFDESQLGFLDLTRVMATAGCPLHNINAALLKGCSDYPSTSIATNREP